MSRGLLEGRRFRVHLPALIGKADQRLHLDIRFKVPTTKLVPRHAKFASNRSQLVFPPVGVNQKLP